MRYDVRLERTVMCPTAVIKANTTWREFPTLWRPLLDEVWAFVRANPGVYANGHNVMLYASGGPKVEVAVEVGVQVTRPFDPAGRVVPSALPGAETATTRAATVADIGGAHDAVREWCSAHGRELTGVSWEIYGDPDPQTGRFDVTVYWALR